MDDSGGPGRLGVCSYQPLSHLVLAHRKKGDQAQRPQTEPGEILKGGFLYSKLLKELVLFLVCIQRGNLFFHCSGNDHGLHLLFSAKLVYAFRKRGGFQIIFGYVKGEDHLFSCDERVGPDDHVLVLGKRHQAKRLLFFQMGFHLFQKCKFLFLVRVLLFFGKFFDPLDPFFHKYLVVHQKLAVHRFHVPRRVHGSCRVIYRIIFKASDHVADGVQIRNIPENLSAGNGLLFQRREQDQINPGAHVLFGLVQVRQYVKTGVDDVCGAGYGLGPFLPHFGAGLCENPEKRFFAGLGQTDDSCLHMYPLVIMC